MALDRFPSRKLFRVVLLSAALYAPVAWAQEVSDAMLATDYTECMSNCLEFDGRFQCEILCGCAMDRFQSELDVASYEALSEQMAGDTVSPESQAFLDETGAICVAELDRLMEEIGLVMPPEENQPENPEN